MLDSTRKLVIVDDDPNVRAVLRSLCQMQGYTCVGEAGNGIDAEDVCRRHEPNVVILDYMMPFSDGEKTARSIRRIAPRAKILAFSAVLTSPPDWADGFLDKTRIDMVVDVLDQLYAESFAAT